MPTMPADHQFSRPCVVPEYVGIQRNRDGSVTIIEHRGGDYIYTDIK